MINQSSRFHKTSTLNLGCWLIVGRLRLRSPSVVARPRFVCWCLLCLQLIVASPHSRSFARLVFLDTNVITFTLVFGFVGGRGHQDSILQRQTKAKLWYVSCGFWITQQSTWTQQPSTVRWRWEEKESKQQSQSTDRSNREVKRDNWTIRIRVRARDCIKVKEGNMRVGLDRAKAAKKRSEDLGGLFNNALNIKFKLTVQTIYRDCIITSTSFVWITTSKSPLSSDAERSLDRKMRLNIHRGINAWSWVKSTKIQNWGSEEMMS